MSSINEDMIRIGLLDSLEIENASLEKLQKFISVTTDEKISSRIAKHLEETSSQIQRIKTRLSELGFSHVSEKAEAPEVQLSRSRVSPEEKIVFDPEVLKLCDDVKNGFAWKNFEIAHYEFLKQQSDRAEDKDTKKIAEQNQKEEQAFADDLESMIPELVRNDII
jgi:ferritin-like metal-binding protein YciE